MSLKSDLIYIYIFFFFFMIYYMYTVPGQRQTAPGDNRKALSLYPFVASFKEISLKSDFIHFFFHDLIHVYSPGAGVVQPTGAKL